MLRIYVHTFSSSSVSSVVQVLLGFATIGLLLGSAVNQVQGLKEGECPPAKIKDVTSCQRNGGNGNNSVISSCTEDEDCDGFDKCCHDGCSLSCTLSLVSGCEQTRRQARILNTLEPSCDQNGDFQSIQCKDERCWCVDEFGFEIGGTRVLGGREVVNCTKPNPSCSAHQCRMLCPHGFDVDENGCSICACRDLCREINCPSNSQCEVIEFPCKNEPNCPPQPVCREGRGLDSLCPFGNPLIIPDSGNPYLCANGPGKPECPPAFQCNIAEGNDYGVCCSRTLNLEKVGDCPVITAISSSTSSVEDSFNCSSCKLDIQCPDTEKCCPSTNCGKTCMKPANLTLCVQQKQLSQLLTSKEQDSDKGYIPQCDENGNFKAKQCSRNGKVCWCADPEGKTGVTGIGPAESVDCNPSSTSSSNSKSIFAQPRGLPVPKRSNAGTGIDAFSVNPCHVGTPLVNSVLGEVQTCNVNNDDNNGCPESYTCIMAQVNSVGVCCLNQTVTEPTKPGMCPFLSSASLCHNNESKSCQSDKECEGDMKCCSLGGSSCFGRAICADPLLIHSNEDPFSLLLPSSSSGDVVLPAMISKLDNFSMCKYLNNIGQKSNGVLKKYKMAFGVPTCKENGEFEPVQCNGGNCWCVDSFGMAVSDIVSNNSTELQCKHVDERPCLGMMCKLNCEYGFVRDPKDGCNLCECRNPCAAESTLCGSDSICEMVDVDCPETMVCPPLPYCLPKALIVPTCPANRQPYIDPILNEQMTCNPRARMLQCPDDHYCHEVDDDLGLCCPVLDEIGSQELVANSRAFNFGTNNIDDQLAEEDNNLDDTVVELVSDDYVNSTECPEDPVVSGECGFKCLNNTDCSGGKNVKCCASECGTTCVDVNAVFPKSNCLLTKDMGFCKAALPKWHFNVETNTCEEFLYSGCGGNSNKFSSKEKCERFCPELTSCERSRELKKREKLSNIHKLVQIPECNQKGEWNPAQCLHEVGLCWCVDSSGEIIKGTIGNKGSVTCNANMKKNNRKSRLLSTQVTRVCPDNQPTHICEPSICFNKICLSDPTAMCRVNPCGGCSIEFYNVHNGQVVNCSRNLTKCELELQSVFNSRAFEIQRQLASKELESIDFLGSLYLTEPDEVLPEQHRVRRLRREIVAEELNSCPQQPIQYLLNLLSGSCTDECTVDSDCSDNYKCCLAECGLKCLEPVTTVSPPILAPHQPPSPIMMLLIPPQCKKENGEYEPIQSQNGVEYCVDEANGKVIQSTITRGTITNCTEAAETPSFGPEERVCSDPTIEPMICRHECLHAKCQAHPNAICVANPCDSCSVSFYSPSGEKLNCEHKCTQKLEIGHCRASIRRYYYNQVTAKCEEFIYGGCQGNDNNFGSLGECEMECGITSRDICTDIPRPEEHTRPCKENETRYYYNSETRKCEQSLNCSLLGNFVSLDQCEASCPRNVLCPIIQDDLGQIEICDRHEACDNVTFCIMDLESVICNVDPCTCKASLTDMTGNSIEACLSEPPVINYSASGSLENSGESQLGIGMSGEIKSSSEERTTSAPFQSTSVVHDALMEKTSSSSTNPTEEAVKQLSGAMEAQLKNSEESITERAPKLTKNTESPVSIEQMNTSTFSELQLASGETSKDVMPTTVLPEDPSTESVQKEQLVENQEATARHAQPEPISITNLHEDVVKPSESETTISPEFPSDNLEVTTTLPSSVPNEVETTTPAPIPHMTVLDVSSSSSPSPVPENIDITHHNKEIAATLQDDLHSHLQQIHSHEETTTSVQPPPHEEPKEPTNDQDEASQDKEDTSEETTTTLYYSPKNSLRGRVSEDYIYPKNSGEQEVLEKETDEEIIITESVESASLEFQTLFFICLTIFSALLILIGLFFAKRKSKRSTSTHTASSIKKFEPLEFNSFVQLQQQIEYTKQQHQQQQEQSNNSLKKFDSTLTIPSDVYYEQLYQ